MADPIGFDPFLGWVDIEDPDNIPQEARLITAADLIRYEKFGQDASARINELSALTTDAAIAGLISADTGDTRSAMTAALLAILADRDRTAILANDLTTTSNMQTTTPLSTPVLGPGTWELEADLFYTAFTGTDLRIGWAVPVGTTGRYGIAGLSLTNAAQGGGDFVAQSSLLNATLGIGGNGTVALARVKAVIVVGDNGGNLALTYGPDTTGSVTLHQHSLLRSRRLS